MGFGGFGGADARVTIGVVLQGAKEAVSQLQGMGQQVTSVGDKLTRVGSRIRSAGQSLTIGLTTPIVGLGVAIYKTFTGFEDAMANVAAFTDRPRDQIEGWRVDVLNLSKTYGESAANIGHALYFLASSQLTAAQVSDVLATTTKAAASGMGDQADLALLAAAAVQVYGVNGTEAMDTLAGAVKAGNIEVSDMAANLPRLLQRGAELGIGFKELAADTATLTLSGLSGSEAVTEMGGVMREMLRPSAQTRDILEQVHMSMDAVRESIRTKGLYATLVDLDGILQANGKSFEDIFGRMEGLSGALALVQDGGKTTAAVFDQVYKSTGALDRAWAASQTNSRKLKIAMANLQVVGIQLGATVVPLIVSGITKMIPYIAKVAGWFERLNPTVRKIIVVALALAAALGPVVLVAGALVTAVGAIVSVLGGLELGIGLLLNPFTLVAIAAFVLLYLFRDDLPGAVDKLRTFFEAAKPVIKTLGGDVQFLGEKLRDFGEWVLGHKDMLVAAIVAIGLAFAVMNPGGAAILGIMGLIYVLGVLQTKTSDLNGPLNDQKLLFQEWALAFVDAGEQVLQTAYDLELGGLWRHLGVDSAVGDSLNDLHEKHKRLQADIDQSTARAVLFSLGLGDVARQAPDAVAALEYIRTLAKKTMSDGFDPLTSAVDATNKALGPGTSSSAGIATSSLADVGTAIDFVRGHLNEFKDQAGILSALDTIASGAHASHDEIDLLNEALQRLIDKGNLVAASRIGTILNSQLPGAATGLAGLYQEGGFVPGFGPKAIIAHGGEYVLTVKQAAMLMQPHAALPRTWSATPMQPSSSSVVHLTVQFNAPVSRQDSPYIEEAVLNAIRRGISGRR